MAGLSQKQTASQKQIQKLSQTQIQAVNFLAMSSRDLSREIYRIVDENPALEIVRSPSTVDSDTYNKMLENSEDDRETLQEHLLSQINAMALSTDENAVCTALIYNLDKNGCYGNMLDPKTLLDKSRPVQDETMLEKCMKVVQSCDPVGCCCKNLEESLLVQAKLTGQADEITLFLLEGHLEFLDPPLVDRIVKKLTNYVNEMAGQAFGKKLPFEKKDVNEASVQKALNFILKLNPNPARDFSYDSTGRSLQAPDVAVKVEKVEGQIYSDDFEKGLVAAKGSFHFQVKYANGDLPEVRISRAFLKKSGNAEMDAYREKYYQKAVELMNSLAFRESSVILQSCAIVKNQLEFFEKGPGHVLPLTRRKIAALVGVHESTVSRFSGKHNGKFFQTDFGTFPAAYFFPSAPLKSGVSAEAIKFEIKAILDKEPGLSDAKLEQKLLEKGIKISRRTVSKYRLSMGLRNSFDRR